MDQSVFGLPVASGEQLHGYEPLTTPVPLSESAFFCDGQNAGPVLLRLCQAHPDALLVAADRPGSFELWIRPNETKKGSDLL